MQELPRPMTGAAGGTPFGVEWNKLIRYLRSLRPIQSDGTLTTQTPFGTAHAAKPVSGMGKTLFVHVCFTDGTEGFLEVYSTGRIFRTNGGTVNTPTVIEQDVPNGSTVIE